MSSLWADYAIEVGCFIGTAGVLLSISRNGHAEAAQTHSYLIVYSTRNGAVREIGSYPWKVVSMSMSLRAAPREGFALGEDGQLLLLNPDGGHDISMETKAGPPTPRGPLRKIRGLGDDMLVVGMNRQVYSVTSDGIWRDLSPAAPQAATGGFEAVAGPGPSDFVCAGWRGELWRCSAGHWQQLDSPTDRLITDIACGPDGDYVACGLAGLILVGRDDHWRVLDQGPFQLNLYSVTVHEGRIYLASLYGLYELKDETLYEVDFGANPPSTAHTVQHAAGALGLIGSKDLFLQEAGQWRRLD